MAEVIQADIDFIGALLRTGQIWPGHEAVQVWHELAAEHRATAHPHPSAGDAEAQLREALGRIRSLPVNVSDTQALSTAKDIAAQALADLGGAG